MNTRSRLVSCCTLSNLKFVRCADDADANAGYPNTSDLTILSLRPVKQCASAKLVLYRDDGGQERAAGCAFLPTAAGVEYMTAGGSHAYLHCVLEVDPQGLQNIKQSPSRLDAAREGFEAAGVKTKDFYVVTGRYDMVTIVEARDETALAKPILSSTAQGNIMSETCRAFTEDEYRRIMVGSLDWPVDDQQLRAGDRYAAHSHDSLPTGF